MNRGKPWVRLVWLALVIYMMFTVGRLAFRNYQLNSDEKRLRTEISTLSVEIQDLKNKIVYFQSDSYKEKMLRARMNMQKEGEKVVVITPEPKAQASVDEESKKKNLSNPEKWWDFFIGL
jgi:cell division protein FtsB